MVTILALGLALLLLAPRPAAAFVTLSPFETIEVADRWSAAPHPDTDFKGLHDGIQVAIEPGMAEELVMAVTGSVTPEDVALVEQAVVAAFRAWESPVLRFDISLDGPAVEGSAAGQEVDVFAVPDAHPAFASNNFFGVTFVSSVFVSDRLLTNGAVLAGVAIRGADIYLNLDMIAILAPIFTREQQPAALQRLLMHELGHALGLHHPNEFAAQNRDTDLDPLNLMAIEPSDPFADLAPSSNVDANAIMSNFPADIPGALVFTTLRNDDRGGRDVLYPARRCSPVPRTDCPISGGSSLIMKGRTGRVRWNWVAEEEIALADLGDPLTTSGWALCVYAGASLALEVEAPAGAAGWKSLGSKGFDYVEKTLVPNGVRKVKLGPNTGRKAKVKFVAGESVLPVLPLVLPITAQVGSRDVPLCVSASYGADAVTKNQPGTVRARD